MKKIGRNIPCPCGSGKKYKQCCLNKDAAYRLMIDEYHEAIIGAVKWLNERYGEETAHAVAGDFFQDPSGALQMQIKELSRQTNLAVLICLHEWLVADAHLDLNGKWVRASELLLSPDGPAFTSGGRRCIEELAASNLSLYEILEVHKGKGLLLRDLLHPDEPPVFVHEVHATTVMVPWDIYGLRILRREGACSLGGGFYSFDRSDGLWIAEHLAKRLRRGIKKKNLRLAPWEIVSLVIVSLWLETLVTPPSKPTLIDAQSREPLLFTTDLYQVSDWPKLEGILADLAEVTREEEGLWTWHGTVGTAQVKTIVQLERLASGALMVECITAGRADAAKTWLQKQAGPLLSHRERTSKDVYEYQQDRPRQTPAQKQHDLPPELEKAILDEAMGKHYEKWLSMPLPILNGKTPLQAVKLKTWKPQVVDLLKRVEQTEARRARDAGFAPFDVSFLWERLGLERK